MLSAKGFLEVTVGYCWEVFGGCNPACSLHLICLSRSGIFHWSKLEFFDRTQFLTCETDGERHCTVFLVSSCAPFGELLGVFFESKHLGAKQITEVKENTQTILSFWSHLDLIQRSRLVSKGCLRFCSSACLGLLWRQCQEDQLHLSCHSADVCLHLFDTPIQVHTLPSLS